MGHMLRGRGFSDLLTPTGAVAADITQDDIVDANESVGQPDATAPDDTDTNDTQPESTGGSFQTEETTQIDSSQSSAGGGSMSEAVLLLLFVFGLRRRVSIQKTHQL